jgi:tRNA 2-selenouridine synthase SelU
MNWTTEEGIIESIRTIAGERLRNVNFTKSFTGIVKDIQGLKAIVEINGSDSECIIPHNLRSYIEQDDIVIVQDVFNNMVKRIIQGTISSTRKNMFHIYDPTTDTIVSSVLQLWDEETNQVVGNVIFEIE